MLISSTDLDSEEIIAQIDAIIGELYGLRRRLAKPPATETVNPTEQLFGSLGQGTWEEYDLHYAVSS